jgi:hypothetical protein
MKKLIITTITATALVSSALGQGLVDFLTSAAVGNRISTNGYVGGPVTGATAPTAGLYYFALFVSTSQTSVNGNTAPIVGFGTNDYYQSADYHNYVFNNLGGGTPSTGWELVGIGANVALLGRMSAISQGTTSANQVALNADFSLTVQGVAGGATANFVAVGWSANLGSTLAAIEAWYANPYTDIGLIGQSAVATGLTLGNGAEIPISNVMGQVQGQFGGFTLGQTWIPEPGTLALAVFGGASLLLFRRRK